MSLFDFDEPVETIDWTPTQAAARARLSAFAPRAGRAYASRRNYDFGPDRRSNVSALSPWIRHRLVLEEEVLRETLARHSPSAAEKFVQEVYWRAYFKGWLQARPDAWTRYRRDVAGLYGALAEDRTLRARYEAAIEGRTGIDAFDAWAGELVETGYLHNHARMWFASIWIFTLGLPWQLGADFFLRHLLDGDPAANTLSWRWVGGLHTQGKTYLARASNIEKYTGGRFNPAGRLSPDATALEEPPLGPAIAPPSSEAPPKGARFGLLITEEDCAPEALALAAPPAALLGLVATADRSPGPVGELAARFARGAVADALDRGSEGFGLSIERAALADGETSDWGERLVDWARMEKIDTVVTAFAPVGPAATALAAAETNLGRAGVKLVRILRPYDAAAWPHANRGFFKLKKKIPSLLKGLGLASD